MTLHRILVLTFILIFQLSSSLPRIGSKGGRDKERKASHSKYTSEKCHNQLRNIPVYWINLNTSVGRAEYMNAHLKLHGFDPSNRITAITPDSVEYNITKLEKPCKRNTNKDLAVILSHLKAIYYAVHSAKDNKYALILEDDIQILFDIDFNKLIQSAPNDFGTLQLVTSNLEAINTLWSKYTESNGKLLWTKSSWRATTKDGKTTLYWSAQAYLVKISVARAFIEDIVEVDSEGKLSFKIINSFHNPCIREKHRPCIQANCLFSDSYIYAAGEPTYVSHIPLFNGAGIGLSSLIHQEHVPVHKPAFERINMIQQAVLTSINRTTSVVPTPPYLSNHSLCIP